MARRPPSNAVWCPIELRGISRAEEQRSLIHSSLAYVRAFRPGSEPLMPSRVSSWASGSYHLGGVVCGRLLFDISTDTGPAKDVPTEAHRRFRADLSERDERNRQERMTQLALHEERSATSPNGSPRTAPRNRSFVRRTEPYAPSAFPRH